MERIPPANALMPAAAAWYHPRDAPRESRRPRALRRPHGHHPGPHGPGERPRQELPADRGDHRAVVRGTDAAHVLRGHGAPRGGEPPARHHRGARFGTAAPPDHPQRRRPRLDHDPRRQQARRAGRGGQFAPHDSVAARGQDPRLQRRRPGARLVRVRRPQGIRPRGAGAGREAPRHHRVREGEHEGLDRGGGTRIFRMLRRRLRQHPHPAPAEQAPSPHEGGQRNRGHGGGDRARARGRAHAHDDRVLERPHAHHARAMRAGPEPRRHQHPACLPRPGGGPAVRLGDAARFRHPDAGRQVGGHRKRRLEAGAA